MKAINRIKKAMVVGSVFLTMAFISACGEKENNEYADLKSYLYIYDVGQYEGAAVVVDGVTGGQGLLFEDNYYIAYETVRESIDKHYYWDSEEKVLTYASSNYIYDAVEGQTEYTVDGVKTAFQSKIVISHEDKAYINVDYVKLMNESVKLSVYKNPNRIVVDMLDEELVVTVTEDTKLRTDNGVSNTIATDLNKGNKLTLIKEKGNWYYAYTSDGIMGFVEKNKVSEPTTDVSEREQSWMQKEPYSYINMEEKVCLGWHQMEYAAGNDSFASVTKNAKYLNVISPTWFKLTDNYGGISSIASKNYVNKAHNKGLKVWGLISDFNYDEDGNYYVNQVVKSTSGRRKLIDNIINEATECGMDGINVDFEMVRRASAEGYVQFIRELAIVCDKNSLVLSVDMYVPTESNRYYDRASVGEVADYLIIMGYDEHWSGCSEAGSVASLPYVTNGIAGTIQEVHPSRVINAIPFYTRVWYEEPIENAPEGAVIVEDAINGDYALSSKAVGMDTAKELIEDNGGTLRWLEELGQYYADYYVGDRFARIWLEDKASLGAKLNVMKQNNLAGVACWKLGLESDEAWEAIGEYLK